MSRLLAICAVLLSVSISACLPTNINRQIADPSYNETNTVTAGVGTVFFHYETMTGQDNGFGMVFNGQATMFELTVIELTQSTITLQYREYTKSPGPQGGYSLNSPWIVKQGYDQEYKYDLAERIIKFKGFEFVVIEASGDSIFYQRIL